MQKPLLSIIVPVYNVEEFIEKCLYSLRSQSYENIEIICVDDGSLDSSAEKIENIAGLDDRVLLIKHEKNRGLFHARLTGISCAKGDYLAFVDSDDTVSCDWFRPLILSAQKEGADMVVGNTINVDEEGKKTYYNHYRSFNINRLPLQGENILRALFAQQGECFLWHTVWNKVYSKKLLDRSVKYFSSMEEPLIMGEDIAFSTVFFALAEKLAFCDNDCYFYLRHGKASTSLKLPREKIYGNVKDIVKVFRFAESFLNATGKMGCVRNDYILFKEKYFRIWSGNLMAAGLAQDKEIVNCLLSGFGKTKLSAVLPGEFYFYEQTTEWDEKFEELKYKIMFGGCNVISFDIFDTLVIRPFWEPKDLLFFVGMRCGKLIKNVDTFVSMRLEAEDKRRLMAKTLHKNREDVTLGEIYDYMGSAFNLSKSALAEIKKCEEGTELFFCRARTAGKELYDLAKFTGKKVVLTSDMYLEKNLIEKILKQCGYAGYDGLFLSSDYRKLKITGSLFQEVLKITGERAESVMHIGDNWNSDKIAAEKAGMQALFFPKAIETYTNNISNIYTGDSFKELYEGRHRNLDSRVLIGQLSIRCLYAVAAYGCFDNPFRSFNKESYYNADPYYMGFAAMGMHLFGVAEWIHRITAEKGYERIIFLARDGFLVKSVYELLYGEVKSVKSDYFYTNRKVLLPYALDKREDLFSVWQYIDLSEVGPSDIFDMFSAVCKKLSENAIHRYQKRGIELDKPFKNKSNFFNFISALLEISFDAGKFERLHKEGWAAFAKVFEGNCVCFDIGYSGRLQKILCRLAGKPIDVFYIHNNGYEALKTAEENGFSIYSFYDFSPTITAVLREYLISDFSAPCTGYDIVGEELIPRFDEKEGGRYAEYYAVEEMQRGALDYCRYLNEWFGEFRDKLICRAADVSMAFENFLINVRDFDRKAFSNSFVEDKVYSGYEKKSFYEIWNWHLEGLYKPPHEIKVVSSGDMAYPSGQGQGYPFLQGKPKFMKALFYWLFDRDTFKEKMRERKNMKKKGRKRQ